MLRSTFVLIVSAYSLALGLFMLFAPALATDYFAGAAINVYLAAIFQFIGVLDAGLGLVVLVFFLQSDLKIRFIVKKIRVKYNYTPCYSKLVCLILLFIFYGMTSFSQNPPISQYYFVSSPNSNGTQFYGYFDEKFGGIPLQKNLSLLSLLLGDDPNRLLPNGRNLVDKVDGRINGVTFKYQPFAYQIEGTKYNLPIGNNLSKFLDDPFGNATSLDLTLPFYTDSIQLGDRGRAWIRTSDVIKYHAGTDFMPKTSSGDFDVCAAQDGILKRKSDSCVVLSHISSNNKEFLTVYQHLEPSSIINFQDGHLIKRGQKIGKIARGSGAHLHFGVALKGPKGVVNNVQIPELYYLIDPFGIYDYARNPNDVNSYNYLPNNLNNKFDFLTFTIRGSVRTIHWRTNPLINSLPISLLTEQPYRKIKRIQTRVLSNNDIIGMPPPEKEQFLVWLDGVSNPEYFFIPLKNAQDKSMELRMVDVLKDSFMNGKRVRLEYKYIDNLPQILAVWVTD